MEILRLDTVDAVTYSKISNSPDHDRVLGARQDTTAAKDEQHQGCEVPFQLDQRSLRYGSCLPSCRDLRCRSAIVAESCSPDILALWPYICGKPVRCGHISVVGDDSYGRRADFVLHEPQLVMAMSMP
jgi:hypothetical protein